MIRSLISLVVSGMFVCIVAVPVSFIFLPLYFYEVVKCSEKTESFKSSEYTFFSGCMIELEDGMKIPLKNYRYYRQQPEEN